MSEYIRYPTVSGGGGGNVSDINGATGPSINILGGTGISISTVGNNITINNTGVTGTPNTLAAFNGAGDLAGLSQWSVDNTTKVILGSFTGASSTLLPLRIQSNSVVTGNLQAFGIDLDGSSATTGSNAININLGNMSSSGGDIHALNISVGTATGNNPQGVTGIASDGRLQINASTNLVSAQTFQIGSRIEHAFLIPPGSPVTGTDSLAVNIAGDFIIQDNIALGPFGLGTSSVGFIADMAVANTKTVDTINVFLPAVALPDPGFTTGGTVTNMSIVRAFAPVVQGGTLNITNLYGFKLDNFQGPFSAAATNAWGVFIEDTALQNHFGGPVDVGSLELNGSVSGRLSINADPTTSSYSLKMPASQGSNGDTLTNDGSGNLTWQVLSAQIKVATIRDVKSSGTAGGSFTSGSWLTRTLNTLTDPFSVVSSLASNQFTLASGTYEIEASAPGFNVATHQIKLRDITNSADVLIGSSEFGATSALGVASTQTSSFITGIFTVSGSTVYEIQHQCSSGQSTNGFGSACNFGVSEVYTQVRLSKLS